MAWLNWLAIAIAVLAVLAISAAAYGSWRWGEATRAMRARLEAARLPAPAARYDAREIEGLPAPVQRFFRAVLKDGQPIVSAVSVEHSGSINMSETAQRWKPFTSKQRVVTRRPGFDWDARIMLLPGVPVYVHDAYIAGAGLLRGAAFGLIPVMNMEDSPELAQGELLRFFAESAWYPTVLLPSQGVHWEAVDDNSARATLTDGVIDTVRAESRGRAVGGVTVATPWQGRFWNYETHGTMRVPMEGEVAWILPGGARPYWRGTNTALAYEFAP